MVLQVEVVDSLDSLASAWDELVRSKHPPAPMMTTTWTGGSRYLVVLDDDDLIGGLPVRVRRRFGAEHVVVMAGQYVDILARPGAERTVATAAESWLSRRGVRLVEVNHALEGARLLACMPSTGRVLSSTVSPWVTLPETFEEYLASRPSQLRHTVERGARRLERLGAEFVVVDLENVPNALREFARLHALRWGAQAPFLRAVDALQTVVPRAVERSEFELHALRLDGEAIALNAYLMCGGLFGYWVGARDPTRHEWRGSGTVLMARSVERACQMGSTEFDLWSGDESYKRLWADGARRILSVSAGAPRYANRVIVQGSTLARRARRLRSSATDPSEGR